MKKYTKATLAVDVVLTPLTGGLWLVWICVREILRQCGK